jgi:molybdopterin synthase sulfur carrier subunit
MPRIEFTPQLARHVECPAVDVTAVSLREALDQVFRDHPALRGYVLDDRAAIRQHVAVFIDNQLLGDRQNWDIPLRPDSKVYVMQALSGG